MNDKSSFKTLTESAILLSTTLSLRMLIKFQDFGFTALNFPNENTGFKEYIAQEPTASTVEPQIYLVPNPKNF